MDVPVENKLNKIACLNKKCCEAGAYVINNYLIKNVIVNLIWVYLLFVLAVYCFLLIPKWKFEYNLPR